jgi:hypothetical protein
MKRPTLLLLLLCAFILTLRGAASFVTVPEASTLFGIAKLVVGTDSIEVTKNDSLVFLIRRWLVARRPQLGSRPSRRRCQHGVRRAGHRRRRCRLLSC